MPDAVPPTDSALADTPRRPPELRWPAVERRRARRLSSDPLLHCLVDVGPGKPMLAAVLLDVSQWGAGLVIPRPAPPGAALVVRLPEAGQERPAVELATRAVHCGELSPGWHLLGVEFVRTLREEEFGVLLVRMKRRPGRNSRPL
jgi:PilZ domain